MIVLTGATGLVGSAVLRLLLERDVAVRCLVHSTPVDDSLGPERIEVVQADFDEPDTYASAMQGCESLFLLTPPHPAQAAREIALVDAARSAGIRHVVSISIVGADRRSPVAFARRGLPPAPPLAAAGVAGCARQPGAAGRPLT